MRKIMRYIQFKEFDSYLVWYNNNRNVIVEKIIMKFKKNNKDIIKVWFTFK